MKEKFITIENKINLYDKSIFLRNFKLIVNMAISNIFYSF